MNFEIAQIEDAPGVLPSGLADLYHAAFSGRHNYVRLPDDDLVRRFSLRRPDEEPILLAAMQGGRPVGLLHGAARGSVDGERIGSLRLLGVDPDTRRQGVGRALIECFSAALQDRGVVATEVDTRGRNASWGNPEGPTTSPFGTVEGVGVEETDEGTVGFFRALGFAPLGRAVSLRVEEAELRMEEGRERRSRLAREEISLGVLQGRCPRLDARPDSSLGWRGNEGWFSAVALHGERVVGYAVGFPTPELGEGRFGLYALEVLEEFRGLGVGTGLLHAALMEMLSGRFVSCEVTTVPEASPGALPLYRGFGFRSVASFLLY